MPSFAALGNEKIGNLVDYLQSLKAESQRLQRLLPGLRWQPRGAGARADGRTRPPRGNRVCRVPSSAAPITAPFFSSRPARPATVPAGPDKVPNPGPSDGNVPSLNPVDQDMFNADPKTFAATIDRYIQHGSRPGRPRPRPRHAPLRGHATPSRSSRSPTSRPTS